MNTQLKYYDWNKTLSYDADVTMIVGARGVGKTYGLRVQFVRDFIKNGYRFVEVCRYKNEISLVAADYFKKIELNEEFKDYIFKTDSKNAYIAKKPLDDEKPEWQIIGYFVALTQFQKIKKLTFVKVKRICLDEAVLDKNDRYSSYLKNEFKILADVVDTVSRERPDVKEKIEPRIYLLGNALDLFNPYFMAYNIGTNLKRGYSWHKNKTFLLHYVESTNYSTEKMTNTVAGRMLDNSEAGMVSAMNEFSYINTDFIEKKKASAKFIYGVKYNGKMFGVWVDFTNGYYYISEKIPKNTNKKPIFALTIKDNEVNYLAAKKAEKALQYLKEFYYSNLIRYENILTKNNFIDVLNFLGVQ